MGFGLRWLIDLIARGRVGENGWGLRSFFPKIEGWGVDGFDKVKKPLI